MKICELPHKNDDKGFCVCNTFNFRVEPHKYINQGILDLDGLKDYHTILSIPPCQVDWHVFGPRIYKLGLLSLIAVTSKDIKYDLSSVPAEVMILRERLFKKSDESTLTAKIGLSFTYLKGYHEDLTFHALLRNDPP